MRRGRWGGISVEQPKARAHRSHTLGGNTHNKLGRTCRRLPPIDIQLCQNMKTKSIYNIDL